MFSYTIIFIYLSLLSTFYPFRVLYFVLSIYCIHVLFLYYFHISIFMYCSFPILFSCYTFHMTFLFMYLHILSYIFIWYSYIMLFICFSYTMFFIYYTFHMLFIYFICHIHFVSLTLYFLYLYTCHILFSFIYCTIHILSSCALLFCSCNYLYFHRIAVLCFSYHVIYSIHVISFYVHACEYLKSGYEK